MSKTLKNIKKFINYLPSKDVQIGFKFLEQRDFDKLKELVDSALIRTKRNLKTDNPKLILSLLNANVNEKAASATICH